MKQKKNSINSFYLSEQNDKNWKILNLTRVCLYLRIGEAFWFNGFLGFKKF